MININNIKAYCCEDISNIENYEQAVNSSEIWDCHHKMETHRRNGKERLTRLSKQDLKDWNIYYSRPANELIFLTHKDHAKLHTRNEHNPRFGKCVSEETRQKISEANKGRTLSDEWRRKISEAGKLRKHSDETKRKLSKALKGRIFSEETRRKMSEAAKGRNKGKSFNKGKHWYNNGVIQCTAFECPDGFVPGRLK